MRSEDSVSGQLTASELVQRHLQCLWSLLLIDTVYQALQNEMLFKIFKTLKSVDQEGDRQKKQILSQLRGSNLLRGSVHAKPLEQFFNSR